MIGLMTVRRHRARLTTALHLAEVRHYTSLVVGRADAAESARQAAAVLLRERAENWRRASVNARADDPHVPAMTVARQLDAAADVLCTPPPTLTRPSSSQES